MSKPPWALNLFCGAGGTGWGIEKTGLYRQIGYDNWDLAVATHNANGMRAIQCDLNDGIPKVKGEVDLVWASCPCQPFSNALEQGGEFDSRDGFPAYLKILKKYRPRLTVFENVAGLTYKRHAAYLATIVEKIRKLGYEVEYQLLDCSDYKIPQARKRLILVGRLDGAPKFPEKSERKISVMDALGTDGTDNPPGVKVVYVKRPIFHQGYKGALLFCGRGRPINLDEPSKTISASGGNHVHWFDTEDQARPYWESLVAGGEVREGAVRGSRRLTVEQMARLQGFPRKFHFEGKPSAQVKQIGNAVPPRLARVIVEANQS